MANPTIPVSVNLIVRNCAASLDACLSSLRGFIDESIDEIIVVDTGSTDDSATVTTARRHHARVIERPDLSADVRDLARRWLPESVHGFVPDRMLMDFGAARQIALDASRCDCVLWIDSDDTLGEAHPGQLRTVVEQGFRQQYEVLLLDYEYWFDSSDGRCIVTLRRERVVDRKLYCWRGNCHETLVPINESGPGRVIFYYDLHVRIRHTAHRDDHRYADARNYLILRSELEADCVAGRTPNARTHYYLGNACRGLGLQREAREHYQAAIDLNASADNRYAAQLFIAEMCLMPPELRPAEAVEAGHACIRMNAADPRGHFAVSRAHAVMGRWQEALQWFEEGRRLPMPQTAHAVNPEQVLYFPLLVAVKALIELGRLTEAVEVAEELRRQRPDYPDTHAAWAELESALASRRM